MGRYCVTLGANWVELVNIGVNALVGSNTKKIIDAVKENYDKEIETLNNYMGMDKLRR